METSALEDINVEQAFVSLVQDIKEKVEAVSSLCRETKRIFVKLTQQFYSIIHYKHIAPDFWMIENSIEFASKE